MGRFTIYVAFVLSSGPAFAEVCDKVRPDWEPASGPVSQFQELQFFFSEPLGIVVISLTLIAIALRRTWFSLSVAILTLAIAGLIAANWFWLSDGIAQAAFREGCTSNPLVTSLVLTVASLITGTIGWTRKSQQI